jgi:phosphate starvation-inducible PhoH-like protein
MEITLQPEDNHRLANLCGPLDENLKQIASALEIEIARRGAHFKLKGDKDHTRLAGKAIRRFLCALKTSHRLRRYPVRLSGNQQTKSRDRYDDSDACLND